MISFEQYSKVKDNYCICYFGYNDEYLIHLNKIKPLIESNFPGINIYLGCKDDKTRLLDCDGIMVLSQIKMMKKNYAYIREIKYNGISNPIKDLLIECGIEIPDWLNVVPDTIN